VSQTPQTPLDRPLLTAFLQELKIICRKLSLYPEEHPQIKSGLAKILSQLNLLLETFGSIDLGIAPNGIYFEQIWLEEQDQTHKDFASFFHDLGIVSICFEPGTTEKDLLHLCYLLNGQQQTANATDDQIKELQQNNHIKVVHIDYNVFQSSQEKQATEQKLWEDFLRGLQLGILDFGSTESEATLALMADVINKKYAGTRDEKRECQQALNQYVEKSLLVDQAPDQDNTFNVLLLHMEPNARHDFLQNALQLIDQRPQQAETALKKLSPQLLQSSLTTASQNNTKISPRLIKLLKTLNSGAQINQPISVKQSKETHDDVVKARLETLFAEERDDLYLPNNYQDALNVLLTDDLHGHMSTEEQQQLKADVEEQSIEHQFTAIIFELLQNPLTQEQERSVQDNLLELSRFFIDTGDFISLRAIYRNWSNYLNSDLSSGGIFDEKILASHTQMSFMNEVLDSFELWGEKKKEQLCTYITLVGPAYSDLLIERLGSATRREERKLWMTLLKRIGGDTQQKVINALCDEPWYLLRNLLIVLANELTPATIKAIFKYASHPHPKVRIEVIRTLFSCNPATANRMLLHELQNPDLQVRRCFYELVEKSHDAAVLERLHRQLESDIDNDEQIQLTTETIALLVHLGRPETLPIFRRLLMTRRPLFRSRNLKMRQQQIIESLSNFAAPAAEKLLEELCKGPHKHAARKALKMRQESR
jgi:hypothetical protein